LLLGVSTCFGILLPADQLLYLHLEQYDQLSLSDLPKIDTFLTAVSYKFKGFLIPMSAPSRILRPLISWRMSPHPVWEVEPSDALSVGDGARILHPDHKRFAWRVSCG
jgi:hypothetical protein